MGLFSAAHAAPCHSLDSTKPIPLNFGASFNVAEGTNESLLTGNCNTASADISVGNGDVDTYVWNRAHYWRIDHWEEVVLNPTVGVDQGWIIGRGNGVIPGLSAANFNNINYFIAYTCSQNGSSWKCGCDNSACNSHLWQEQRFSTGSAGPGSCTDGTAINTCVSGDMPKYCNNNATIVDFCDLNNGGCGCSNGWVCSSAGTYCEPPLDETDPLVNSFTSSPSGSATLSLGESITFNYSIHDETALAEAILYRAIFNTSGCNDSNKDGCSWSPIATNNHSGQDDSGSFDQNPGVGTYFYGLHAVDTSGNHGDESTPPAPGPIKVTVYSVNSVNIDEISLNGTWRFRPEDRSWTTIPVPEFWDARPDFRPIDEWGNGSGGTTTYATYELRNIQLPDSCTGVVKIEFTAVNHIADVYVDNQFVGNNVGGWIPFNFDITDFVVPGSAFTLRAEVRGGQFDPIIDSAGKVQWPVGWFGHERGWGIIDDVWLKCYGKIYIDDVYIKTSYRNNNIEVDYTVINTDNRSRTVAIATDIARDGSAIVDLTLSGNPITLAAGQTRTITLSANWSNPLLWMPGDPNLYYLNSKIVENSNTIDTNSERFGFREIWISGNQYILNGVRLNLRGESITQHCQSFEYRRYDTTIKSVWNNTINKLLNQNINVVRFHQCPPRKYNLDMADERGLLVIEESAIMARRYIRGINKALYLANSKRWIEPWVKSRRNHPSVIIWSAENEMGIGWLRWMTSAEMLSLGDTIRLYDQTRPVNYDGDGDVGDAVVNRHYIEGYGRLPTGSIYQWSSMVRANKPTGVGEFLYSPSDNVNYASRWWQGTMSRGLRYTNFADIRPYTIEWAWDNPNTPMAIYMKNSFNSVALFDKDYDDLGIDPIMNSEYPNLDEGAMVSRNLVLYNDEFQDTNVTIEVRIQSGGTTYASGQKVYILPLGEHIDISCSFQVPYIGGSTVDIILITYKNGVKKFEETRRFNVNDRGLSGTSLNIITLH